MKKRMLAGLLCALLAVMLLPKTARAETTIEIELPAGNGTVDITGDGIQNPFFIHLIKDGGTTELKGSGYLGNTNILFTMADKTSTNATTGFGINVDVSGTSSTLPLKITLKGVTIGANGRNALKLNSSHNPSVQLTLEDTNTLTSTDAYAAVQVPEKASLTIQGDGTLAASGHRPGLAPNEDPPIGGAGIGGNGYYTIGGTEHFAENCGSVTINGGTIKAEGGYYSAGIGGGGSKTTNGGSGGNITINGGTVEMASGSSYNAKAGGAGIGGGGSDGANGGSGGNITINGGTVKRAGGGASAAGIGGGGSVSGNGGASGSVTINSGTVAAGGGSNGAGIGGGGSRLGTGGTGNNMIVNGGMVYAWDGGYSHRGAAIGGGGSVASDTRAAGSATVGSFAYEWVYLNHVNDQGTREYALGPWLGASSNVSGFVGIRPLPTISPASGTYGGPVSVTVRSPVDDIDLYFIKYTLDGSDPETSSSAMTYCAPFTVMPTAQGVQVKAYVEDHNAISLGYRNKSSVVTAVYTLGGTGGEAFGDVGPDVPKTGDETPLALLCGLILLCGAGIAARRRKRG